MIRIMCVSALALLAVVAGVSAQSSPGWTAQTVPTIDQWNSLWASKVDVGAAITTSSVTVSGLLTAGGVQTGLATVAQLGTCSGSNEGEREAVVDAISPTFLSVLAGGGTIHTPVYCNGTNWVAG